MHNLDDIEVTRPPSGCGAYVPPSQFKSDGGKPSPNPAWRPTVFLNRERLIEIVTLHEQGSTDRAKLWGLLGAPSVTPALAQWFSDIRPILFRLVPVA